MGTTAPNMTWQGELTVATGPGVDVGWFQLVIMFGRDQSDWLVGFG